MRAINEEINIQDLLACTTDLPASVQSSIDALLVENASDHRKNMIPTYEMLRFRDMAEQVSNRTIYGYEPYPGQFLGKVHQRKLKQHELTLLTAYYNKVYHNDNITFYDGRVSSDCNAICVYPEILEASRITLAGETINSKAARSHVGAHILARFLDSNDQHVNWPGTVVYFFRHWITVNEVKRPHDLCFVDWYERADDVRERFLVLPSSSRNKEKRIKSTFMGGTGVYGSAHVELWKASISPQNSDSILPIHRILCRFAKGIYTVPGRQVPCVAVIPLARKIPLW
jgi:hypothetical protein